MKPSAQAVLLYMVKYGSITAIEAERYLHCHRLAARIADLKAAGVGIESTLITRDGHRWASYRLVKEPVQLEVGL